MRTATPILRRSIRALLFDEHDRLVLLKRSRPGEPTYWKTSGGGVELIDATNEATLERELAEELGARATIGIPVFYVTVPAEGGVHVQHFYLARLLEIDFGARTDFRDYDTLDRVALDELGDLDFRPRELRSYLTANMAVLLADAPAAA
jgi:8-oxo-dGTP pyrophosphatase MutT (NUDIX family)